VTAISTEPPAAVSDVPSRAPQPTSTTIATAHVVAAPTRRAPPPITRT
jgi:hypothetical protein